MSSFEEEEKYSPPRTIFHLAQDVCFAPFRIATSPLLLRTYLRTVLLLLTSSILFGAAVIAYTSFYYTYIPIQGVSIPIYLQYGQGLSSPAACGSSAIDVRMPKYPYGIANVQGLASRQKYDVYVELRLPRSRMNLEAGNWMVGLDVRGSSARAGGVMEALGWEQGWEVDDYSQGPEPGTTKEDISKDEAVRMPVDKAEVLARSRRPAILTYRSLMTEVAYRALRLPLYVLGWGTESEMVNLRVMEGVQFEKGWRNVPSSIRLELRSKIPLEVYSASVDFVARLEGLRWVMYTYRLSSAMVFIGIFWSVEMGVVLFTWALFTLCLGRLDDEDPKKIKKADGANTPKTEPADLAPPTPMSDTDRTFPTLSSQKPLHYSSSSYKEECVTPNLEDIPVKEEAEADDEDDDFLLEEPIPNTAGGVLTDSGIGTSMESSFERRGLSRRKSQRDR